jgi:hypothetical protein
MNRSLLFSALVLISNVNFGQGNVGQQIDFGTAASFVIFTNTGAVTNTGSSVLDGHVGSNEGAISGFANNAQLNGNIYNKNSVTAQAKKDLSNAYEQLWATENTHLGHAAVIGNGETLYHGVYIIPSAASLEKELFLDAESDTNALFIFKFDGAYSPGPQSKVTLINGALAKNVIWLVKGAITIATESKLHGTFLAYEGAVSVAAGSTIKGKLFTTTGAISIDKINLKNVNPSFNYVPLSIKLHSFLAYCNSESTVFKWSTATESNNDYFTLEQSTNGINWTTITRVNGAGNSTSQIDYTFDHTEQEKGISYYRLKQTDDYGQFSYSEIISQNNCNEKDEELILYPNPTNARLNLNFRGSEHTVISVSIYNLLGEIVYFSEHFESQIELVDKSSGLYFLHLELDSTEIIEKFMIKK